MRNMKRALSLLLAVIMVMSCFTLTVSADYLFGSCVGNIVAPGTTKGSGTGPSGGTRAFVRMKAVPMEPGDDQYYFTIDRDNQAIDMKPLSTIIDEPGYAGGGGWVYFWTDASNRNGDFYDLDMSFGPTSSDISCNPLYTYGSAKHTALLNACGYPAKDSRVGNFAHDPKLLDRLFTMNESVGQDRDITRAKVAAFFGLTGKAAESYYIVVERFDSYHISYPYDGGKYKFTPTSGPHAGASVWELFYAETYAMWKTKDPHFDWIMPGSGIGRGMELLKVEQGKRALFPDYTTRTSVPGYALYSFCDLEVGGTAANIAVEYQGDPDTSEPGKFVSTGALAQPGDAGSYKRWDFGSSKWIDTSSEVETLKFEPIDASEDYSIVFASNASFKFGDNVELTSRLQNAFESAPGQGYSSGSLVWGYDFASGGYKNAGYTYKVRTLDGYASTASIEQKFATAFNAVGPGGYSKPSTDTSSRYKNAEVVTGSWDNFQCATGLSDDGVLMIDGPKTSFVKDKNLGMGYEFIVRGMPITSQKVTCHVYFSGGVSAVSQETDTWREDYNTTKTAICPIDDEAVAFVVVPNKYRDDGSVVSALEGIRSPEELRGSRIESILRSSLTGVEIGDSVGSVTIGLGSTRSDGPENPPEGYTVYEVTVESDEEVPPVSGEIILPAYMLNRYFDNVIQRSSSYTEKFTLNRDWAHDESKDVYYTCWVGRFRTAFGKDWRIEYHDAAGGGVFGKDTGSNLQYYYLVGTGNWSHSNRTELTHAWSVVEDTQYLPSNLVVDYAYNLVRAVTGDKRAVSAISYRTYQSAIIEQGSADLLMISNQFGVGKPATIKPAAQRRSSMSVVGTFTETFNIKSRFTFTGSPLSEHEGPSVYHAPHKRWICTSSCEDGGCCGGYWQICNGCTYYPTAVPHTCQGFRKQSGGTVNTINYHFNNIVLKYSTMPMPTGGNDYLSGVESKPISSLSRVIAVGAPGGDNEYRFATVRKNNVLCKYYPETYMLELCWGKDIAGIADSNYTAVYVIGEESRTAASSSLYLFKINGNGANAEGTVYSDAMQGGTGIYGLNDNVSIPAGADVTVAADLPGVQIDLFGYSLDLLDESFDGSYTNKAGSHNYSDIVKSSKPTYSPWGNSGTHDKLAEHFKNWCDDILDVKNFAADFELYVSGDKKSENFSATVGNIERSLGGDVTAEYVYNLVVEKGSLQTSKGDYHALIAQIAEDYECSTGEATSLFETSALYTAIINAMETCKNPVNRSGICDPYAERTAELGDSNNWYDEVARTFVIRRYKSVENKIHDIIATDKIDYQLAPTGRNPSSENVNSGTSNPAYWRLSLFFDQNAKDNVNKLLLGSSSYYTPQSQFVNLNAANSKFSILINSIRVDHADFVIPASSTQDFYN